MNKNIRAKIIDIFKLLDGRTIIMVESEEEFSFFKNVPCKISSNEEKSQQVNIYYEAMSKVPNHPEIHGIGTNDIVDLDKDLIKKNNYYVEFSC